ncbi:transcription factor mef2A-like isoform X2 [Oppia nitens]|uniref:transcription factor mef2A-like isoform X2 n=1 Tax=Oppia nitens TaxID=1686743 RepID=UPI0023DA6869|nr:transcription factor mef2A-like isoform X2 [Oppia nitens]
MSRSSPPLSSSSSPITDSSVSPLNETITSAATGVLSASSTPSSTPLSTTTTTIANQTNHSSSQSSVDPKEMMDNNSTTSLNAPKYGTPVPNRVFVGGIPGDATEIDVMSLFGKFGKIMNVNIILDRAGVPRGYGFVTFETEDDAKRVIQEKDNLIINNRKLNVSVAIKKHQNFTNEMNFRSLTNGAVIYNAYPLMNTSQALYGDYGIYPTDSIPIYNFGVNPQMITSTGITTSPPQSSYPYAYQPTSGGVYLTTQPSMAASTHQLMSSFQSSTPQTAYPILNGPFRLPMNAQNMNQVNPYIHMSSSSTPPLSQNSSIPVHQLSAVAGNHQMPPIYAISPNGLPQPSPLPNGGVNSSGHQSMAACIHNYHQQQQQQHHRPDSRPPEHQQHIHHHSAGDNGGPALLHHHTHSQQMSPQVVELMPIWSQKVPNNTTNTTTNNSTTTSNHQKSMSRDNNGGGGGGGRHHHNHHQYSQKPNNNMSTTSSSNSSSAVSSSRGDYNNRLDNNKQRNTSYNNSHHHNNRKPATNSYTNSNNMKSKNGGYNGGGGGGGQSSYGPPKQQQPANNSYETECQTIATPTAYNHHNNVPVIANTSALQGMPFVKHTFNHRYHHPMNNHHLHQQQQQYTMQSTITAATGNGYHQQQQQQQPHHHYHHHNQQQHNGSVGNLPTIKKVVNGIEILTVPSVNNGGGGGGGGFGPPISPPLTPGGGTQLAHK